MTNIDRWVLPEGIEELLPKQAAVAEQVRRDILDLFKLWGYELIMPPLIEFTDSLLIGLGTDIDLQSFRLTDQVSGKPMAVRADITPQATRIDSHSLKQDGVNRLCYAGSVLHTRAKALMASRCPIQVGAEIYGESQLSADIESVSLMLETLSLVGVNNLTLDLGHVGIYKAVVEKMALPDEQQARIFDAVQRKSLPDLKPLVDEYISDAALAKLIFQLPKLCGDKTVLSSALTAFSECGIQVEGYFSELEAVATVIEQQYPEVDIYFDLAELRGYHYHTGLVFAAFAKDYGYAVANGGRYDEVGKVFGASRPATGFNTDLKALITLLGSQYESASRLASIAAHYSDDKSLWASVKQLRDSGEIVVFYSDAMPANCNRQLVKKGDEWLVEAI